MPRLSSYEHVSVHSASGKRLGRVGAVLFHPMEPRVVGLQIDRASVLGLIERKPHFVLLRDVAIDADELRLTSERLPKDEKGEKVLGHGWDETVVWHGMPVRSASGDPVGVIHDAVFSAETGVLTRLIISTGVFGDAALGRLEVAADLVRGFDGESVRVLPGYNEIRADGGAAKAVAAGAAAVKVRTGQVAEGALQVGVAAAGALGRSLRRGTGRKAIDKLKSLMNDDE